MSQCRKCLKRGSDVRGIRMIGSYHAPLCYDCQNALEEWAQNEPSIVEHDMIKSDRMVFEAMLQGGKLSFDDKAHYATGREMTASLRDIEFKIRGLIKAWAETKPLTEIVE